MKKWIGRWNTDLEYAKISRNFEDDEDEGEDFRTLTDGIEFKKQLEDNGRPTQLVFTSGAVFNTHDGTYYEMTRGMMASFNQQYVREDGIPVHYFLFQAWNRK